jgi:hypothetical protein
VLEGALRLLLTFEDKHEYILDVFGIPKYALLQGIDNRSFRA